MLVDGAIQIGDQIFQKRDAMGISQTENIEIEIKQKSTILVIEVPMN
jgi:hypothetical protein